MSTHMFTKQHITPRVEVPSIMFNFDLMLSYCIIFFEKKNNLFLIMLITDYQVRTFLVL